MEAGYIAEYNKNQRFRDKLLKHAVKVLLAGHSPDECWLSDAKKAAAEAIRIQHQQEISRRSEMLDAATHHGWWDQRGNDFNLALLKAFDVAWDISHANVATAHRFQLGSYPGYEVDLTTVVAHPHSANGCLLRFATASILRAVSAILRPTPSDLEAYAVDAGDPHFHLVGALEDNVLLGNELEEPFGIVHKELVCVRNLLGSCSAEIGALLAQLQAEVLYERLLRSYWEGNYNPIRSESPEFYWALDAVLHTPKWRTSARCAAR